MAFRYLQPNLISDLTSVEMQKIKQVGCIIERGLLQSTQLPCSSTKIYKHSKPLPLQREHQNHCSEKYIHSIWLQDCHTQHVAQQCVLHSSLPVLEKEVDDLVAAVVMVEEDV